MFLFHWDIFHSINDAQLKLLGDVEMKQLFECMRLFVGWLQGGLYDFSSLPISVFKHLEREDIEALEKIPLQYSSMRCCIHMVCCLLLLFYSCWVG